MRRGSDTDDESLLVLEATGRGVELEVELDGVLEVDEELEDDGKLGRGILELVFAVDAVDLWLETVEAVVRSSEEAAWETDDSVKERKRLGGPL
jgi:hypothetical protein